MIRRLLCRGLVTDSLSSDDDRYPALRATERNAAQSGEFQLIKALTSPRPGLNGAFFYVQRPIVVLIERISRGPRAGQSRNLLLERLCRGSRFARELDYSGLFCARDRAGSGGLYTAVFVGISVIVRARARSDESIPREKCAHYT